MDTLPSDLLSLVDKQLDAPTSSLLGISSAIKIFMTGYDDFDYKKNVKWLLYGIRKRTSVVPLFLLETKQYKTLEYIHEFYKNEDIEYVFYLMRLRKRILPPSDASFRMFELRLFIEQTIKDHWWEGTVYICNLIKDENRYDYNEHSDLKCILCFAYKYDYLDALQLVDFRSPKSELIGMITSDIDYGDQLLSAYYQHIGRAPLQRAARVLCRILGINKDLSFLLKTFDEQLYIVLEDLIKSKIYQQSMVLKCFVRAIEHSNIVVVNTIYDLYCALHKKSITKKKTRDADTYHEMITRMVEFSLIANIPSVYEKYLGKVDNPIKTFYDQLSIFKQCEFVKDAIDYGNYNIFRI